MARQHERPSVAESESEDEWVTFWEARCRGARERAREAARHRAVEAGREADQQLKLWRDSILLRARNQARRQAAAERGGRWEVSEEVTPDGHKRRTVRERTGAVFVGFDGADDGHERDERGDHDCGYR